MKRTTLAVAILFSLAGSASILAEEHAVSAAPVEAAVLDTEKSEVISPEVPQSMPGMGMGMGKGMGKGMGMGMKQKESCKQGKGQHRKKQYGKKYGGMKHDGGHEEKGQHDKHAQVVNRLDMIEARMAKIEAMLESLMRR